LACRAIGAACVGVNGESNLGFDLSQSAKHYTYFTAPAGHTFIWRLFRERDEAVHFLHKLTAGEKKAVEWAEAIPLASAKELKSSHSSPGRCDAPPLRHHLQRLPALRGGQRPPRRGLRRCLGGRRGAAHPREHPRPPLLRAGREGRARRDRGEARG